ncbi:hypothetical protein [Desulfosarcina ovata]|uniref:hypothetical protein n=1 Tax=Desulfosarcina ovata TaxID=83564 RepID=UPI0012D313E9|nr:hypothetical protein [Desulfosarcina ovata]
MLFQSPSRDLDPWGRIGVQLTDAVKAAGRNEDGNLRQKAGHALEKARLDPIFDNRCPFELSGSQRQREKHHCENYSGC